MVEVTTMSVRKKDARNRLCRNLKLETRNSKRLSTSSSPSTPSSPPQSQCAEWDCSRVQRMASDSTAVGYRSSLLLPTSRDPPRRGRTLQLVYRLVRIRRSRQTAFPEILARRSHRRTAGVVKQQSVLPIWDRYTARASILPPSRPVDAEHSRLQLPRAIRAIPSSRCLPTSGL